MSAGGGPSATTSGYRGHGGERRHRGWAQALLSADAELAERFRPPFHFFSGRALLNALERNYVPLVVTGRHGFALHSRESMGSLRPSTSFQPTGASEGECHVQISFEIRGFDVAERILGGNFFCRL
jgi:hypothetical protein